MTMVTRAFLLFSDDLDAYIFFPERRGKNWSQ